jgi:hypothetical protein
MRQQVESDSTERNRILSNSQDVFELNRVEIAKLKQVTDHSFLTLPYFSICWYKKFKSHDLDQIEKDRLRKQVEQKASEIECINSSVQNWFEKKQAEIDHLRQVIILVCLKL